MSVRSAPRGETGETVDPRIEQRRRQVAAAMRRRRGRRLAMALGLVTLMVGAWVLTRTSLMEVASVELEGAERTPAEAVLDASGIVEGDQLVDLDTSRAAGAIEELPWVEEATVERHWLDRSVAVTVAERTPAAALERPEADPMLVDGQGRLLEATPAATELPRISGVAVGRPGEQLEGEARELLTVAGALSEGLLTRVAHIRPAEASGVELVLEPEGVAVIGEARDLDVKVRTLQTMFAAADMSCLSAVDVRVPDTAVLTREERCE